MNVEREVFTVGTVQRMFATYHATCFGTRASDLPKLDLRVEYYQQFMALVVGKRSLSEAHLLVELMRKLARYYDKTMVVVVPFDVAPMHEPMDGFVRSPRGWMAVC